VPACSPDNLDLCNDLEKENISQWMKLSEGEMDKLISGVKDDEEAAHKEFDAKMQELQEQYNTFNDRNTLRQARIRKEIKFLKEIRAMSKTWS
jgi:hypothetical protein